MRTNAIFVHATAMPMRTNAIFVHGIAMPMQTNAILVQCGDMWDIYPASPWRWVDRGTALLMAVLVALVPCLSRLRAVAGVALLVVAAIVVDLRHAGEAVQAQC